jgi:hypothetical protein
MPVDVFGLCLIPKAVHVHVYEAPFDRIFIYDFFAFCKKVLLSETTEIAELVQKLRAEC